jgi:hypothetical protein
MSQFGEKMSHFGDPVNCYDVDNEMLKHQNHGFMKQIIEREKISVTHFFVTRSDFVKQFFEVFK